MCVIRFLLLQNLHRQTNEREWMIESAGECDGSRWIAHKDRCECEVGREQARHVVGWILAAADLSISMGADLQIVCAFATQRKLPGRNGEDMKRNLGMRFNCNEAHDSDNFGYHNTRRVTLSPMSSDILIIDSKERLELHQRREFGDECKIQGTLLSDRCSSRRLMSVERRGCEPTPLMSLRNRSGCIINSVV